MQNGFFQRLLWALKEVVHPKSPLKVVVRKRGDDYHASLDGRTGVWGSGKSLYGAIGNMVNAHPEEFGIIIERGTR